MKPKKIYRVNCIISEMEDIAGHKVITQRGFYLMPCFTNKKEAEKFIKGTDLTYTEINL